MDSLDRVRLFIKNCNNGDFSYKCWKYYKPLIIKFKYYKDVRNFFVEKYIVGGYGFKSLIKEFELDITYTKLRFIFEVLDIERRKGYDVITERLRNVRSKNALGDKNHFYKWPEIRPELLKTNSNRGINGYYYNNSMKKYVWLRSSYEYLYSKYLDENNIKWDVEYQYYNINNRNYLPDFFIFENDNVCKIVEIKSEYYSGYVRDEFINIFNFFKNIGIEYLIISDVELKKLNSKSLRSISREWKKIRRKTIEN